MTNLAYTLMFYNTAKFLDEREKKSPLVSRNAYYIVSLVNEDTNWLKITRQRNQV